MGSVIVFLRIGSTSRALMMTGFSSMNVKNVTRSYGCRARDRFDEPQEHRVHFSIKVEKAPGGRQHSPRTVLRCGWHVALGVGRGLAEHITTGSYKTIDLTPFQYQRIINRKPYAELGIR